MTTVKAVKKVVIKGSSDVERRKVSQALLKKYGAEIVWTFDGKQKRPPVEVIPTQSHGLNWATARGGFPRARTTILQGRESSGKTTVAYHIIKVVQMMGGHAALLDVENSVDLLYIKKCGVRLDDTFFLAQPDYAEQAWTLLEELVQSGQYDVIVLDSIAALAPLAELRGKMTDQQMALQARINAKSARRMNSLLKGTKTALVYINQLRDKIGGFSKFGPQTTTTGGRALKHAASLIMELQPTKPLKAGERRVGFLTRFTVIKNKIGQPSRRIEVPITFNYGLDERLDFINVLLGAKILRKGAGAKKGIYLDKKPIGKTWMDAWSYFKKNKRTKLACVKRLKTYLAGEAVTLAMSSDED